LEESVDNKNVFFSILIVVLISTSIIKAQWVQTNRPYGGNVHCIALSGTNIFAGIGGGAGGGGIFLSTNDCKSWIPVNNGLPLGANVYSLAVVGTNIFAGINGGGVYLSTNNGSSWNAVNNGLPPNANVFSLAISGTSIFVVTVYSGGVYRSTDNGSSWTDVNDGLPQSSNPNDPVYDYEAITISGNNIFIGSSNNGIYRSTNNGTNWTYCGFKDTTVYSLAISGSTIFAGTFNCGIFRSNDNGKSWIAVNNGLYGISINSLVVSGTNIFAGTGTGGISLSTNEGSSWNQINNGLPTNYWVYSVAIFSNGIGGTNLIAGNNRGVYLSTNNGESWADADSGLTGIINHALVVSGTNLFAGTNSGVFLSTNNGANWTAVNNSLSSYSVLDAEALAISGTNLYAAIIPYGANGICLSTDNGTSWTKVCSNPPGGMVTSLAIGHGGSSGTNIFAGTSNNGLFLSTNNGTDWAKVNSGLPENTSIWCLAISDTNMFAEINSEGNYYFIHSTDNGTHWTTVTGFPSDRIVYSLAVYGTNIFAGIYGAVYLSTDNGGNWTQVNLALPANHFASSLTVSNTNIFAGDYFGSVWKRPLSEIIPSVWQADINIRDNGNVSQSLMFGQSPIASDGIDASLGEAPLPPPPFGFDARFHLPTGDDSWIDYRYSNLDTVEWLIKFQPGSGGYPMTFSWDKTSLPKGNLYLKDIINGSIVNVNMKTDSSYILTNSGINELEIKLKLDVSAIKDAHTLPSVFSLSQNYPNPFNPSTVIRYGLPGISNVKIKIYNLLGQEIQSLVNETQNAGYHEVTWNASNKASGIYLYTIDATNADGKGNFRSAKKLILMK
jgi:photosystem II stability/assembly factor-like uncharacterized protein